MNHTLGLIARSTVIILLGIGPSQRSSEVAECGETILSYCGSIPPGDGRILVCMKDNEKNFSPSCQELSRETRRRFNELIAACKADVETRCAERGNSGAKVISCLRESSEELSAGCRNLLQPATRLLRALYEPGSSVPEAPCPDPEDPRCYCSGVTSEQKKYVKEFRPADAMGAILASARLTARSPASETQSSASPSELRPIIPSRQNRIRVRYADRCTHFGTPQAVATLEWVGRELDRDYPREEFPGPRLLIGDLSAPRGGRFRRINGNWHFSHTVGQDADLGFVQARKNEWISFQFHEEFDPLPNWKLLKKLFANPYTCVKAVFLDPSLVDRLRMAASSDPDWPRLSPLILPKPSHADHFHIRFGAGRECGGAP